jgi:outer membrane protein TolC
VQTSEATARASAASLGDVQVSIAAEVALSLITLRSSQARLAIAQANLASQLQTLQLTDWRAQAGLLSALEVEQARAASAQTQAQLPALQTAIAQTGHALAVLTGQPPAALATWWPHRRRAPAAQRPGPEPARRDTCASGPMCGLPNSRCWPPLAAWRRPMRRAIPASSWAARWG